MTAPPSDAPEAEKSTEKAKPAQPAKKNWQRLNPASKPIKRNRPKVAAAAAKIARDAVNPTKDYQQEKRRRANIQKQAKAAAQELRTNNTHTRVQPPPRVWPPREEKQVFEHRPNPAQQIRQRQAHRDRQVVELTNRIADLQAQLARQAAQITATQVEPTAPIEITIPSSGEPSPVALPDIPLPPGNPNPNRDSSQPKEPENLQKEPDTPDESFEKAIVKRARSTSCSSESSTSSSYSSSSSDSDGAISLHANFSLDEGDSNTRVHPTPSARPQESTEADSAPDHRDNFEWVKDLTPSPPVKTTNCVTKREIEIRTSQTVEPNRIEAQETVASVSGFASPPPSYHAYGPTGYHPQRYPNSFWYPPVYAPPPPPPPAAPAPNITVAPVIYIDNGQRRSHKRKLTAEEEEKFATLKKTKFMSRGALKRAKNRIIKESGQKQ